MARPKMFRLTYTYFFAYVSFVMFLATAILTYKLITTVPEPCNCPHVKCKNTLQYIAAAKNTLTDFESEHKLAVLVPFRERFEELMEFVPYIDQWLNDQKINHDIFIINQVDQLRFNRGSLINAGYNEVKQLCDYIIMHDVDLLPMHKGIKYTYPTDPTHLASPEYHPRYKYPKFIGGIFAIANKHFEDVNGLSNKYWGWGLEDDEFYVRLISGGYEIKRYSLPRGNQTLRHIHGKHRKRDTQKCYNQREVTRKRDVETGFHDVKYKVISYKPMSIGNSSFTVINVELECNRTITPWCECAPPKTDKKN